MIVNAVAWLEEPTGADSDSQGRVRDGHVRGLTPVMSKGAPAA